ncbi:MAG: TetR/AcrR family transcriptional regulator [Gemmatimonadales bacterium]
MTDQSAVDEHAPRWQRRPDERRGEILQAAFQAFGERGFEGCTLGDIARRAGISAGTVCHYFGSKADLFQAVVEDRSERLVADEEALLVAHQGPVIDLLHAMLRRVWDHMLEPGVVQLSRVIESEGAGFPESSQLYFRQLQERWTRLFRAILDAGARRGEFRELPLETASRIIGFSLMGLIKQSCCVHDQNMPDQEALWAGFVDMIDHLVLLSPPDPSGVAGS